ncbi:MAG TPA: glycerol-3-phosphate dehydrogenase/oxidase [Steroidobacteraceae bacterium]|nr:glycerol-3-phosphate dehydrogenase/oxidase [Steroidobacteraceae bacterium]
MRRSLEALADTEYDVLVIGAGACGAATAREACLRGFKTCLIERDDFGGGTSAHCFKVVHGGIRYLQHADIPRLRHSCRERAILLRIAPHLVSPMPFAVPTFGQGKSSKWFLGTGMRVYDLLTLDCNAHVADPKRRIGSTRFLGYEETRRLFPEVESRGLTGAAVFEDGQMYNPPRLVLAFVAAAEQLGAAVANYVEAERLSIEGSRVTGVNVRDRLSGQRFDIRARLVINAAGPWAEGILQPSERTQVTPGTYSRDACLVLARRPASRIALAMQGRTRDADALLARNARHLFLVPWREHTLLGVWHTVVPRDPDQVSLSMTEMRSFIEEINACHPAMRLEESEVSMVGFGLVPFGDDQPQEGGRLSFGKQSRLVDHRRENGLEGLLSLISVRYTVARADAVAALDRASEQLGKRQTGAESADRPLPGGEIEDFAGFLEQLRAKWPEWLPQSAREGLAQNYGTHALGILQLAEREPALRRCLPGSTISHAEIAHSLREEMAVHMSDIVFRRTDLGTAGHPDPVALEDLEKLMQHELGWSPARTAQERAAVEAHLGRYHATGSRASSKPRAA